MVCRLLLRLCCLWACCAALPAWGQYYDWGRSPAGIRWMQVEGPRGKIVYPDYFSGGAAQVLSVMEGITPTMTYGFSYKPLKVPAVLHTQNFNANGIVMWAPKRMELELIPDLAPYAQPWFKQLVAHESRHTVQYGNLYRSFMKPLGWFIGQQSGLISQALIPVWLLEGDAVQAETQMASFGRALQPSFTIGYRAYMAEGTKRYVPDKWFCGSYKDYIPDHYQLGYQMTAWSRERYGDDIWDRVARYSSKDPYTILTTHWALGKYYKTSPTKMLWHTFGDLKAFWDSLPPRSNSASLIPTPTTSYTVYTAPIALNDTTILALKRDLDRPSRIVKVDPRSAGEKKLFYTGWVGTAPVLRDSTLYWSEYRSSIFWDQRVNARAVSYDLRNGRKRLLRDRENALYPTPLPDGRVASVGYDYTGRYSIDFGGGRSFEVPDTLSVHGLAYDDLTGTMAFITLGDAGMSICRIDTCSGRIAPITQPGYTSIYNLRAGAGKLTFNSIASGYDEVHVYDLARGEEFRVTTSRYGSVSPSAPVPGSDKLYMTTYTLGGYRLSHQRMDGDSMQRIAYSRLPENIVNPPRRKWNVVNLDTVRLARTIDSTHRVKRYRKGLHLFNPHSWAPWSFNPSKIADENKLDIGFGATVMSQNLLTSTEAYLSYGYSGKGHRVRGSFGYYGLAPKFDFAFDYGGGKQLIYGEKVPEALPVSLSNHFQFTVDVSLPMTLASGYHIRTLTPFAQFYYLNALLYKQQSTSYEKGVTRGVAGLSFIDNVRMGTRDFLPRWGYAVKFTTVGAPFRSDFGTIYSLYGRVYTPGVARHHSLTLRGNVQYQPVDRYNFYYKELYPRGADYDVVATRYAAFSADYQLPLCYPDGGINSIVYFNRIRLNLYYDFARFIGISSGSATHSGRATTLWSYGGIVTFDMRLVRMPKNDTSLGVYVYKPSDRNGVVTGVNLSLPL